MLQECYLLNKVVPSACRRHWRPIIERNIAALTSSSRPF